MTQEDVPTPVVVQLLAAAKNPLCVLDAGGNVAHANPAFIELTGLRSGMKRSFLDRALTEDGAGALGRVLSGESESATLAPQSTHAFDATKSWTAKLARLGAGLLLVQADECVGSRQSESELSWSRLAHSSVESEALGTAIDDLPIGVCLVEIEDGKEPSYVAHNSAYTRLLGAVDYGGDTTPMLHVLDRDGRTLAADQLPGAMAARTGETIRADILQFVGVDGSRRTMMASAAPVAGQDRVRRAVTVLLDVTERVRAEEAQRASERQAAAIFAAFRDPLAVLEAYRDESGAVVDWIYRELNPALLRSLGVERQAILGTRMSQLFPGMVERGNDLFSRALETGEPADREVKFQGRDFLVRVFRLDETQIVMTAHDTTQSKRIERDLRASTERFENTACTVPGVLYDYVIDAEGRGRFVYLSPGVSDIFELSAETLLRDPARFWRMLFPEDARGLLEYVSELGSLVRREAEARIVTASGAEKRLRFTWRANPPSSDGSIRGSGFILDVTEAHMARVALDRSRRELLELVEKLPIGIFVARDGAIVYANPELARSCGCSSPNELVGVATTAVFSHDPDQSGSYPAIGAAPDTFASRREWTYKRADGRPVLLETSSRREVELQGRVAELVTVRDLTELRAMRSQLMQADRLASVGMLAAGVAHEINNPLAYVIAALDFMAEALQAEQPALGDFQHALGEAREGASRVRQVVRDLKTFSRAEPERVTVVDLLGVLDSSANMAMNEIRHRAQLVKVYGAVPRVRANEARLGQVFLNLLVNAAQAIPEGRAAQNEIRILTTTSDDGGAVIEIQDTGAGIPEAALEHIFDPFFTTKPAGVGTGLGLALCKTTILAMGGTISVSNLPKGGASFRVSLAAQSVVTSPAETTPARPVVPQGRRGRVLVVDDEVLIANGLGRVLGKEHDVVTLTSARDALKKCEAGERFDVIVCDLMMPELTGMDVHQALLELDPEQARRMVFLTGGAFTARASAFLDKTSNICLEKPYDPTNLRALVRGIVG
jgi:two-component system cell cycle sensor histidine kinase/response regulator CckA